MSARSGNDEEGANTERQMRNEDASQQTEVTSQDVESLKNE